MTTDGACFILDVYITMLWPLSWDVDNWRSMISTKGINYLLWPLLLDDDNWRRMFHTWCIYYHALTVVVRRWQMTKHDSYLRDILPCSDCCHLTMTTDGACFIHTLGMYHHALTVVRRRLQQTELVYRWMIYYHAPTSVIRRWQLTEHVSYLRDISSFSYRWHETMPNYGAWFIPLEMYNHALYVFIRRK